MDDTVKMMKYWTSPVYAFFEPIPDIVEFSGGVAHEFTVNAVGMDAEEHQSIASWRLKMLIQRATYANMYVCAGVPRFWR